MKLLIETKPGFATASFGMESKDKSKKKTNYIVNNDTQAITLPIPFPIIGTDNTIINNNNNKQNTTQQIIHLNLLGVSLQNNFISCTYPIQNNN